MYALTSLEEGIVPMRDSSGTKVSAKDVAKVADNDRTSRRKFRKIWRKKAKKYGIKGYVQPHVRMHLVDTHVFKKTTL